MIRIGSLVVAFLAIAVFSSGCKVISASFTSPSDWSRGSSDSSSGSSKGSSRASGSDVDDKGGSSSSYREDIRVTTVAAVENGEPTDEFVRDVGRVAEQHGIADWEAAPDTFVAIGKGLREAGASEAEVDAFLKAMGYGDGEQVDLAREGWRSASL